MRLKVYSAPTMMEAMTKVRDELGPDAIIISSEESAKIGGARVTAALESIQEPPVEDIPDRVDFEKLDLPELSGGTSKDYDKGEVSAVINYHGLTAETAQQLNTTARSIDAVSLTEAFAVALETVIHFAPLTDKASRPIMLVGPPGAGKTVSAAKLTADAVLNNRPVSLISTDTGKAGGVQQLDHFAQLMKETVSTAESAQELAAVLRSAKAAQDPRGLTIIDTQGVNPFKVDDMETLISFMRAADIEPVLVMPAGTDPSDAADIAKVFKQIGVHRFIATRLDAARRYGSIVSAARPGYLALAAISRSPFVAEGLETASPQGFAKLITRLPGQSRDIKGAAIFDRKAVSHD